MFVAEHGQKYRCRDCRVAARSLSRILMDRREGKNVTKRMSHPTVSKIKMIEPDLDPTGACPRIFFRS